MSHLQKIALYFLDVLVPQIRKLRHRNRWWQRLKSDIEPQAGSRGQKVIKEETERDDSIYLPNNKT